MGKVTPERIKYFRKRLGLKQEELAELCGVDASCISRWEIGKWSPSVESSLRLAKKNGGHSNQTGCGRVSRTEPTGTGPCPHINQRVEKAAGRELSLYYHSLLFFSA